MASKLLRVLNKIENERNYLITRANMAGYNFPSDSSIASLASAIKDIESPSEYPDAGIMREYIEAEDWVRPSEWPNTIQILRDTPIDNGKHPYLLVLLRTNEESTVIHKSQSISNAAGVADANCVVWEKVLTSDGTEYTTNSADITHTWDTSKDIIISEGEYSGTYRYIIYFTTRSSNGSQGTRQLAYEHMVEVVGLTPKSSYAYPISFPSFFLNSDELLNIEYHDTEAYTNNTYMYMYNSTPNRNAFENLYNLRSLSFHCDYRSFQFVTGSGTGSLFRRCYRIRHIDMSSVNCPLSGSTTLNFDIKQCYSLVTFKSPNISQSNPSYNSYIPNMTLGYNPLLKLVKVTLGNNYTDSSYCSVSNVESSYGYERGFVPEDCSFQGRLCATVLPYNWKGHSYFGNVAYNPASYTSNPPTGFVGNNNIDRECFDLSMLDSLKSLTLSYSVLNNSGTNTYYNPFGSYLYSYGIDVVFRGTILFPEDFTYRLDLSNVIMTRDSFLTTTQNLKDLSQEGTVYNPTIKIHKFTKSYLTPQDIQALSNKGWTVV